MQREPPRRAGSAANLSPPSFDSKLENEEELIDSLVALHARGHLPVETWTKLHEAAVRDERVSELAFAYEAYTQGRRIKLFPPAVVAEVLFKAATYFADVFGDELGARNYLDRVLSTAPGHQEAFERLCALLTKAGDVKRLAEAHIAIAQHRPRAEQIEMLRKAASLIDGPDGDEEKAIDVHQQLLRLDPSDARSRTALEERYLRANRHRDVARLLEQALAAEATPAENDARAMRSRLVELYATQLHEPERTMPHVEALLASDPANETARRAALKLLAVKGLAARAGAALADACEKVGTPAEVASHLAVQLEHTRGPKRLGVLTRLGALRQDRLNDATGAYEAFEQALLLDPSEDDLRVRFVTLSLKLGKGLDAARTLSRVGTVAKDARVRARISAETGELLAAGGDTRKARATFVSVLATPAADSIAILKAARALSEIYATEKDSKSLADVLEKIAETEQEPDRKRRAIEQLGELASKVLHDSGRATQAWRRLVDGPSRARALAELEPLYEASGAAADLAWVLDERAKDASGAEARRLSVRAAEVLTRAGDAANSSAAWKRVVDKYGASREVLAHWIPLLEAQRAWTELAQALAADAQLAPEGERAGILARLGHVHAQKTKQLDDAIEAYARALAIDATEKTSRAALDRLVASGDHRLAAASVLEPIYRAVGGSGASLLRVLDVKATLSTDATSRIAALAEAVTIASQIPEEKSRALELAARGLGESVAKGAPLATWVARIDALAAQGVDAKKLASLLVAAMGERAVTTADLSLLARRVGEAQAAGGDAAGAIATYRRALDFEPESSELLAQIDALLRDQGNPVERVALYRAALARGGIDAKRRRTLLHAIAALSRDELEDNVAAIASYEMALADDDDDHDAHAALVDLFTATENWDALAALLEKRIARAAGREAIVVRAQLAELAATHGQYERAKSHARALLEFPKLPVPALDVVERVAEETDDVELARAVIERRASEAEEAREKALWLTRLGILENERASDVAAATSAWRRAASLAQLAGDDAIARDLYERVREVSPKDVEATKQLVDLLERTGVWAPLPALYEVLVETAENPSIAVSAWMMAARVHAEMLEDATSACLAAEYAFALAPRDSDVREAYEKYALLARESVRFAKLIEEALIPVAASDPLRVELALARARALSSEASSHPQAILVYRELLSGDALDEAHARAVMTAFEALLDSAGENAQPEDRRWLHEQRVARASEGERVAAMLAWAAAEETQLGDLPRALRLHRRVLSIDVDCAEAMTSVARIALALGDVEGAVGALVARRDRSEGAARSAIDLEIATLLLDRGVRHADALRSVGAVLEGTPSDAQALALCTRLLAREETRAAAISMLERTLESVDDAEARAQVLSRLLDTPSDAASRDLRRGWFERLIDLRQQRGELDEALGTIVRAAAELPTVQALWDRAESLARSIARPDEVAALYASVLASPVAREDALAIGQRAVAFYEEWFEDSERVVRILERVLEIDPGEPWAFDRLKLIFDAAERWDDLFALYDRAIAAASGARRIELLEDAAQVAKDFASQSERAIGYLEQLLALRSDARLSASLERLYERHGRHRELVWLLYARVPQLSPREAQATRARIAGILLGDLVDAASALTVVEELIAGETDESLDVAGMLERILAVAPASAEVRESIVPATTSASERPNRGSIAPGSTGVKRALVRQRAAALLKERYAAAGRDADLARVLEIELESIRSVRERIRRHLQLTELYSTLGREEQALEHAVSLVLLEPDSVAHREHLATLAARVNRRDRLAEVLVAAADDCTDDALRVDLLMEAGVVHADYLGDDARAIDLFFRVLDVPGHDVAHLAVAHRLAPLLDRAGRPFERLEVMERAAALEPRGDARRALLGKIAALASQLGEGERAIAAWRVRLRDEAGDSEALAGLVVLLEKEHRWRALIDVLIERAALASGDVRRADRARAAEILQRELGAIDEAIVAWRAVETEFGTANDSSRALAALLRAAERWAELGVVIERLVDVETGGARAELLRELGDLRREHLLEPRAAIDAYQAALAIDEKNPGSRAGLLAIVRSSNEAAPAVTVLLRTYEADDDWQAILGLLEPRLSIAGDEGARIVVLCEAARLSETRANDRESAFTLVRRALSVDPSREDIALELQRLAEATNAWRSLAEAYREALEEADLRETPPPWAIRLRLSLGEIQSERLDDPRAALATYLRALSEAPGLAHAVHAAIRVAAKVSAWDAAAKIIVSASYALGAVDGALVRVAEEAVGGAPAWDALTASLTIAIAERATREDEVARDLEAQLGEWHSDRRGDPDAAEQAYVRALAHEPADASLLASLAQLQRRTRGRPLVESLLRLSSATGDDLDLLREAADVARTSVADRALARSIVERVMRSAVEAWLEGTADATTVSSGETVLPARHVEWAIAELSSIHEEDGEPARIVDLLLESARLPFPLARSRAMRHDAAALAVARMGDVNRAIGIWRALFDEDPADEVAVAKLVEALETNGRLGELLEVRKQQLLAAPSVGVRVAVRLASARLQLVLGDVAAAVASLSANLEEDERNQASLAELVALFEREGRHDELAELFALQAQREEDAGDARAAADLWSRAADLSEAKRLKPDEAIARHRRVLALEPRARSHDALARLLAAQGEWNESAKHLDALAQMSASADLPGVALRLAEALAAAGDAGGARARLEEAFARDPSAEQVVARLAQTYRSAGDWRALADLLAKSAAHARDKGARRAALGEAADLYRRQCDAPDAAVPLLEQASDLEPDNRGLRLALADALGAARRYTDARTVLRTLIDSFGGRRPKERAPVHYQLARLDLAMGDRAQALVELDSATRIDPANPEILRALAELARDDGQLERAERSYRALLAVLRRVEEPADDAPIVRTEVLVELAALARATKEAERASELVESALEIATRNAVEATRLEAALLAHGDHATLARALQARVARGGKPEGVAEALDALARVLDEHLQRPEEALDARMRAIALAPHVPAFHAATVELARRVGALPAYAARLLELGKDAEARDDDDTASEIALLVGSLYEHDLGDDTEAVRHYERAQRFQLRLPEVLRALDRVYERLGDSVAQARVLAKRIDIESMSSATEATTDAYYRLARLKLTRTESLEEGCDLLVAALRIAPDILRAKSVLEATAPLHATSARLVDLYEQVGRAPGNERALVDALKLRADLPDNDASPLREAVDVARALGDTSLAESLLRKLIGRARDDAGARTYLAGALTALADLREAAGDVADAVALKRQAAELADGDEARRLHFEVARLAKDSLRDLALATKVYEQLHEHEPADREAWEPLLEVYRLAGAHAARVALIAQVVQFVDDTAERSRLRLERARVTMNELGRVDESAPMLREIVEDDPSQVDAAILLAGILEKSGDDEALAELLARQIDSAKDRNDASSVAELSLRLGALVEKRDKAEARDVYYAALEWAPQNRECLRALVRLHETDEDPSERADVMERLLPLEEDARIEELARGLATLRGAMGDKEGARRALEAGYRARPASTTLREELEASYAVNMEWANLASLYETDAGTKAEPAARGARLREAARVWRDMAKDSPRAADVLRRARAETPEDTGLLRELVDTLASSGNKAAATLELTLAIDWLGDDAGASAPLLAQRAALRAELGDDDGALFDFEHAFRAGGAEYAGGMIDHLTRIVGEADEESDPSRLRAARLRLAEILALTGGLDRARGILGELVKLDAKDRDALRALAVLEERAGSWDAASSTYRRLVALEDAENVVDTALRLADACEHAGRLGDARGGLERARMVAPMHEVLNARLLALYAATGAYRELAALHLEEAKAARDVAGRFAHLLAAGTLMLQHGTDANAALVHLREASALRPGDLECCAWLAEGLAAIGKTQEALELLTASLAPHKGRRSRELALVHQAFAHVSRAAKDTQGELTSLTSALDMDPQNGSVASELALVARQAGHLELAQRALRAVTMLKVPAPLSRGLAYQYLGEIAQKQGDVKRAVMMLKRAVDDDPNLASARALLTQLKSD